MVNTDATYKSSILFANWQETGKDIWHPFYKRPTIIDEQTGIRLQDLWTQNQDLPFATYASAFYELSLENKVSMRDLESYAFHIDCGKLVHYAHTKLKINNFYTV